MALTSDPHAWLRPIYARLAAHPAFSTFAVSHQFDQLCEAVAAEHPSRVAAMRDWNATTQRALLDFLAMMHSQPAASRGEPTEIWRVHKQGRELRCTAVYLPTGIDVRLMEGADFRRTQLCRDAPAVETLSQDWRDRLLERGWAAA